MYRVYRIVSSDTAPEILFPPNEPYSSELQKLDGKSVIALLPADDAFKARLSRFEDWNWFYKAASGSIAISESSWEHCMDIYYLLAYGDIEIPWIVTPEVTLRLVNPLEVLNGITVETLESANKLFRINGYPPTDIFCLEGTPTSGDEFKYIYDSFGFRGIDFEEIWSG